MKCKKNLALGDCLARGKRIRFARKILDAFLGVSPVGGSNGWHVAAVLLDGRNPRPPAAEEFRAHFLLLMPCFGLLLRSFFAGAQRAALLPDSSALIGNLCVDGLVPRS